MKKVLVVGCPGAGKSTFSKILSEKTGLPIIHLDFYYHDNKFDYYINKPAWFARVNDLMKQDSWIMDGNYSSTFPERFKMADTIFFFDFPLHLRMYGIFKRRWQLRNKKRDDMPDNWKEKTDWEFVRFVWKFKDYRPRILNVINESNNKKIITFKNRKDVREFLKSGVK